MMPFRACLLFSFVVLFTIGGERFVQEVFKRLH